MARGLIFALLGWLATAVPASAAGWQRMYDQADSTTVALGVVAEKDSSRLVCRCRGGGLEILVIPDSLGPGPADSVHRREVVIGHDASPSFRETWILAQDGASLFSPDPWAFAYRLVAIQTLRLDPLGSRPLEFVVRGNEPLRSLLAACPAPAPAPAGAADLPVAISKVAPDYPAEAREKRVTGTVVVQAFIDEDGRVIDTKVVRSIPGLDEAAVASIRQWRFRPAHTGGKPVRVWTAIPIRFSLDGQ